jgi:dCMP deaminase
LVQRLIPRPDWNEYFMALAKITSTRSTCSSRPVGCVIVRDNRVLVSGYNGPPSGEPHCTDKNERGDIYCARRAEQIPDARKFEGCRSIHAEENALNLAGNLNICANLEGASIYTTLSPCIKCTEKLSRAGIRKVFYEHAYASVDSARDAAWEAEARNRFEVYEEILISGPSAFKMASALLGLTSDRLLPSE